MKILILVALSICDFGHIVSDNLSPDPGILLHNNSKNTWYLNTETPETSEASCQVSGIVFADNTYTFHSNGTFEFNHGTITEDPACQENCCNDLVNLTGTWKFTHGEKGLRITALNETGNASNKFKIVLYDATIVSIDENVLKLSQLDEETGVTHSFEFRKK